MFRPAAMMRLSAVVLERDERAVLRQLGRSGAVQLIRTKPGPETAPFASRDPTVELARCDRILTRVENLRRSLEIAPSTREPTPKEMTLNQADETLGSMEKQSDALLKHRRHLVQRWSELTSVSERMSTYRGLDVPLDDFDRYSFLHFVTGSLPLENLEALRKEAGNEVALLPLPEREGRQPLIAMTTRPRRAALEDLLLQAGFQHENLPAIDGATTDSLSQESARERERLSSDLESANAELRSLAAAFAEPLAEIERLANIERHLLEAELNFPRTEAAILLTGWVPAGDAPALEQDLKCTTAGRCVIETAAPTNSPDEQVPVLLRHPRLLRPFQMLVSAYGLPGYHELEPTLFVAISYLLMFGMMFGDAGHGAILAGAGLATLLAGHRAKVRDAGLLLLFGGLSSIGFGITYGSFFGIAHFKKYALWHDPLEGDPMALMYGAIGIGIVMISLGLILNIINCFRRGDVIGGLLDKFGVVGALFYWGALVLIIKFAAIQSRGLVNTVVFVFIILPILGWALKGPVEYFARRGSDHAAGPGGGLFARTTESIVGAFEAILSYLANTISFVRLAAYAMSHAALLVAAFMMANEVKHLSAGGAALSVLIIILGNFVAIVLEGVIASVQALRLEYYEFFGKFFSGDGQAFKPFRLTPIQA